MRIPSLILCAALTIWFPGRAQADAVRDPGNPALHDTRSLLPSIFGRLVQPGAAESLTIPFYHPDCPIIDVLINGESRPLLFDTGTNTSLLHLSDAWPEPARMYAAADTGAVAAVEGKRLARPAGGRLRYAAAPLVRLGGVSLRNVPWRLYDNSAGPPGDFAGALAPVLLRPWLVEVNNTALEIRLHDRREWHPLPGAVLLPVLSLPRGLFVPLVIDGEQLWFHFDTGFSGAIGLSPAVLARHPLAVTMLPGDTEHYQGWHAGYSYDSLTLHALTLPAYPGLSWADGGPLTLSGVEGIAYREAYDELAGYGIGGIAGSGLWQRFDYVLDYELGRLYLWPRENWKDAGAMD